MDDCSGLTAVTRTLDDASHGRKCVYLAARVTRHRVPLRETERFEV